MVFTCTVKMCTDRETVAGLNDVDLEDKIARLKTERQNLFSKIIPL